MNRLLAIPVLALLLLGGCASESSLALPGTNLLKYKRVFVEHRLADGNGIDDRIVAELKALGYDASDGALTMMPQETQLVVTYDDQWNWDFHNYLIGISLTVSDAHTQRALVDGSIYRPSMAFGGDPQALVHDAVIRVFRKTRPSSKPPPDQTSAIPND